MPWLQAAMKLPGKAIHIGVYLWHLAGMRGQTGLVLNLSGLAAYATVPASVTASRCRRA